MSESVEKASAGEMRESLTGGVGGGAVRGVGGNVVWWADSSFQNQIYGEEPFGVSRALQGVEKYRSYNAMRRRVPTVTNLDVMVQGIASRAKFRVVLENDAGEDKEDAFGMDLLHDMPDRDFSDVVTNMVESLLVGYSLSEVVMVPRGGYLMVGNVHRVSQASVPKCYLDDSGRVVDFVVNVGGGDIRVPRYKCLYVRNGVGGGPFGVGLLRGVAEKCLSYIKLERSLYGAVDSNLRDVPDALLPSGLDDSDEGRAAMKSLLQQYKQAQNPRTLSFSDVIAVRDSEGGDRVLPVKLWEYVPHPKVPIGDNDLLMAIDREVALGLSVQSEVLGLEGGGSYALAKEQKHSFHLVADGALQRVAEELGRFVKLAYMVNGMSGEPRVVVDNSSWIDPVAAVEALPTLGGIVPAEQLSPAVDKVLELMGLPPRMENVGGGAGEGVMEDDGGMEGGVS